MESPKTAEQPTKDDQNLSPDTTLYQLKKGRRVSPTKEEVLEVLINQTKQLNTESPTAENEVAIASLENALQQFKKSEDRTQYETVGFDSLANH